MGTDHVGTPPYGKQNDRQTRLKTLPSHKLRMCVVIRATDNLTISLRAPFIRSTVKHCKNVFHIDCWKRLLRFRDVPLGVY